MHISLLHTSSFFAYVINKVRILEGMIYEMLYIYYSCICCSYIYTIYILMELNEKRIYGITLFVPNSIMIMTPLTHQALLVVINHDATLAVV